MADLEVIDTRVQYQMLVPGASILSIDLVALENGGVLVFMDRVPFATVHNSVELFDLLKKITTNAFAEIEKKPDQDQGSNLDQDQPSN